MLIYSCPRLFYLTIICKNGLVHSVDVVVSGRFDCDTWTCKLAIGKLLNVFTLVYKEGLCDDSQSRVVVHVFVQRELYLIPKILGLSHIIQVILIS